MIDHISVLPPLLGIVRCFLNKLSSENHGISTCSHQGKVLQLPLRRVLFVKTDEGQFLLLWQKTDLINLPGILIGIFNRRHDFHPFDEHSVGIGIKAGAHEPEKVNPGQVDPGIDFHEIGQGDIHILPFGHGGEVMAEEHAGRLFRKACFYIVFL